MVRKVHVQSVAFDTQPAIYNVVNITVVAIAYAYVKVALS